MSSGHKWDGNINMNMLLVKWHTSMCFILFSLLCLYSGHKHFLTEYVSFFPRERQRGMRGLLTCDFSVSKRRLVAHPQGQLIESVALTPSEQGSQSNCKSTPSNAFGSFFPSELPENFRHP